MNSISDVANQKRADIAKETEDFLAAERVKAEEEAAICAREYLRDKTAKIRLETGRRISESAAECRKEVFACRSAVAERIFSAAAEKLENFTQSDEYKSFVFESAEKIISFYGSGRITLLVRSEDMKFQQELCEKYPGVSVAKDDSIKIGGVKGIDSLVTLLLDDTLDSRLKNQKKWFEENSGLYISMR